MADEAEEMDFRAEGPDCRCGHPADQHHLRATGRYVCIALAVTCGCTQYDGKEAP